MSAITKSSPGGVVEVSEESLARLAEWVTGEASPEQLAWESTSFREMRDWLKRHKAAKRLRVAAIRLECIALRKIALGGMTAKIPNAHDRRAAEFFGSLQDDEFNEILADTDKTTSPSAVHRHYEAEREAPAEWVADRYSAHNPQPENVREFTADSVTRLQHTVRELMDDLIQNDETFTVESAANQLYEALGERLENHEGHLIPPEIAGEPLREVVRRALRTPEAGDTTTVDGVEVNVPRFVTFESGDGELWQRVAWGRATAGQLLSMVETREEQAHQMQVAAGKLRRLYEALSPASEADRVAELAVKAGLKVINETENTK